MRSAFNKNVYIFKEFNVQYTFIMLLH